ncbi:MAG: hypothetical protein KJP16_15635 [Gammaproteobacteria bacterium]|nr:hypothetical protein [Gammaproteobacteria bacterium]NNC56899.1 hypothetical protein [Woeseiaceae bacterium]NNL52236.1 hypothetical protein [Woeseiaceae bacterium]
MLKTFIAGILLGIVGVATLLYAYPVVDQHREESIVTVAANGGNIEAFHTNVPMDRILIGAAGQKQPLPEGMIWPADPMLRDVRVELFKIRNARDIVVGVASRTAARDESADVIDWVLHLPARGSMFVNMQPEGLAGGFRNGELRAGSREFAQLRGVMTERWVPNTSGDADAPVGRIELRTTLAGAREAR